jgi:abequosyltransferase
LSQTRNSEPLLSFAIPTYNFGAFIGDTIRNIQENAALLTPSQFEIVILDGGSKDQTDDVIAELITVYGNIRYIKNPQRGGIDRDLNAVADAAHGRYIWLFSADDLLVTGWDRHILPLLTRGGDIFLVPAILCDFQMKPLRPNPIFRTIAESGPVDFDLTEETATLDNYLDQIATLEAMFSFMSAVIVDTRIWHSLPVREDYFGSCWAHCARLMPVFFRQTKITYVNHYLINKRGGNDSFMEHGFVNRIAIAIDGWGRIIQEFFTQPSHRETLFNALRKDMPLLLFIYAKLTAKEPGDIDRLNGMLDFLYKDITLPLRTRIYLIIYRLIPTSRIANRVIQPFLPLLIRIRHKLKSAFS